MTDENEDEEYYERLNSIPYDYSQGEETFKIDPKKLGWTKMSEEELSEELLLTASLEQLGLHAPADGEVENPLEYPKVVDGEDVVNAYDQEGGTCVGASSTQATTGRHKRRSGNDELFDYIAFYCQCRKRNGDNGCNKNAGSTMQAAAYVMEHWGAAQIINGVAQPPDVNNGTLSHTYGNKVDDIRTAIGNGIYIQIGFTVRQAFEQPKKFPTGPNGTPEYWVYWQEGSWGSVLGGHAMFSMWWSDRRQAFYLPGSWGYKFPPVWMSRKAFERCLAEGAEILICIDRTDGPVGKIALAEPFTITPELPVAGDKVQAHLIVKNVGDGPLTVRLAIEDMLNGNGGPGFGITGDLTIEPGAVYRHEPVCDIPVLPGNYRWRGDYGQYGKYYVLGTVTKTVPPAPPTPVPPVADFTASPISGKAPLNVLFTDLSTNKPTSWIWDFGDDVLADGVQNPAHVYKAAGTYTVKLTAANDAGSNTVTKTNLIIVTEEPPPTDVMVLNTLRVVNPANNELYGVDNLVLPRVQK